MTANYVDKIMNVQLSLAFVHIQQEPYKNKTKKQNKQTKNEKQTNKKLHVSVNEKY